MYNSANNKGLGKGLSALLGDYAVNNFNNNTNNNLKTENDTGVKVLDVSLIDSGQFQPRKRFNELHLQELAQSIKSKGVIQPIIVRSIDERFEIIAGERRWRASQIAGLKTIPAIIIDVDDKEAAEFALLENIQREDLTPIEEAEAYQKLMQEFDYTQEALSVKLGKSRSHIANMMRLMNLPEQVRKYLDEGQITIGHAKVIVGRIDAEELANKVINNNLSVRELEKISKVIAHDMEGRNVKRESSTYKNSYVSEQQSDELNVLQNSLTEHLGMKVVIDNNGVEGGKLVIYFNSLEKLDMLIQKIT